MKRTRFKNRLLFATFVSVLIISALFGTEFVHVARANPWLFVTFGPPIPGTIPPFISIYSPQNNTVCASNVYLSLHISKPLLPAPLNSTYNGLTTIWYALDGNVSGLYFCSEYSGHGALGYAPAGVPEFNYSINLILPGGKHSIEIFGAGIAFAESGAFFVNSTSTVVFTADPNLISTPSSAPTTVPSQSPSPTSSPTSSPTPSIPFSPTPDFSMPSEYLNYTISKLNGTYWAKIDGEYPMYCVNSSNIGTESMVYPMPPGATNISVFLGNTELQWSNFTEEFPSMLHHTALGDWPMIQIAFNPSDYFVLKIHYEHPIAIVNGSYTFLYDLNIGSYLSSSHPNSTAYFKIRLDSNCSNLQVFTAPQDNVGNNIDYRTQEEAAEQEIEFEITSQYSKPLPGDEIVTFTDSNVQAPEFPSLIILPLLIAATVMGAVFCRRSKQRGVISSE